MTKKFTLMMLMFLIFGSVSFSQTAKLKNVPASPGDNVSDSLMVTGFTNIGSITFNIRYKPSVMTYTGYTSASSQTFYVGVTDSTLHVIYTAPTPPGTQTFPDGLLLKLNFHYLGMTSSPLDFLGSCEVTQGLTVIHPTYTNGSVYPYALNSTKATIVSATAATGGNVPVVIKYDNFSSNVGAITQKIQYDPTKLTFINVTSTGTLVGATASASGGIVSIVWTNTGGTSINWPTNTLVLNFQYIGSTVTNLNFYPGCIISTNGGVNIPVSYFNGVVSLNNSPTAHADLTPVTGALQGQEVQVPLMLSGFPAGTAAFTLNIPYDSPRMSFIGVVNNVQPVTVNQNGSTLTIAWTDYMTPNINSTTVPFLKLKFMYNGIGVANVNFGNGCVFSQLTGGNIFNVQVAYTNATVTPAPSLITANLGFGSGAPGAYVLVPITFSKTSGLVDNMGALTMFVNFDFNKLTFLDAQNNINHASVNMDPITHLISIGWSSATATDLTGKFLDLRFICNLAGPSALTFADGCQLANIAAAIVPVNWVNGGVNTMYKVSGLAYYNSMPNPNIPLVGYTIMLKSTGIGNPIIATAVTNGSGYYELMAPPGNYFLDASPSATATWDATIFDVVAMFEYTNGTPLPYENPLRITAGDVNQNGDIDIFDVVALFDRLSSGVTPPDYTEPDFVFSHPLVSIISADVPNQDIMGLSSGDVLGTNPTP
jgi:hypothetical protein